MTKVFISYARSDQEFALRLAKALEADGFDIWIDQLHIETGRHWETEIQTALELCPAFLLILSPASVASRNVQDEVSFALELEKDIVPVLYQPCNIPFRVRRHQYVDFTVGEEQGLAKFLESLRRLKAPKQPMVRAVGNVKTWPTATVNQGDLKNQIFSQIFEEELNSSEARMYFTASGNPEELIRQIAERILEKSIARGARVKPITQIVELVGKTLHEIALANESSRF